MKILLVLLSLVAVSLCRPQGYYGSSSSSSSGQMMCTVYMGRRVCGQAVCAGYNGQNFCQLYNPRFIDEPAMSPPCNGRYPGGSAPPASYPDYADRTTARPTGGNSNDIPDFGGTTTPADKAVSSQSNGPTNIVDYNLLPQGYKFRAADGFRL